MNAVDTNVFVYWLDPNEPQKRALAARLLEEGPDLCMPWQVLCELGSCLKKLEGRGVTRTAARRALRDIQNRFPLVMPTAHAFERALDLQERFSLSF